MAGPAVADASHARRSFDFQLSLLWTKSAAHAATALSEPTWSNSRASLLTDMATWPFDAVHKRTRAAPPDSITNGTLAADDPSWKPLNRVHALVASLSDVSACEAGGQPVDTQRRVNRGERRPPTVFPLSSEPGSSHHPKAPSPVDRTPLASLSAPGGPAFAASVAGGGGTRTVISPSLLPAPTAPRQAGCDAALAAKGQAPSEREILLLERNAESEVRAASGEPWVSCASTDQTVAVRAASETSAGCGDTPAQRLCVTSESRGIAKAAAAAAEACAQSLAAELRLHHAVAGDAAAGSAALVTGDGGVGLSSATARVGGDPRANVAALERWWGGDASDMRITEVDAAPPCAQRRSRRATSALWPAAAKSCSELQTAGLHSYHRLPEEQRQVHSHILRWLDEQDLDFLPLPTSADFLDTCAEQVDVVPSCDGALRSASCASVADVAQIQELVRYDRGASDVVTREVVESLRRVQAPLQGNIRQKVGGRFRGRPNSAPRASRNTSTMRST